MDQIIVGIMAFFMVIGAVDKALFDGKFGYGKEFENGLNTMGPLALVMVGIMCVSPALGTALGPALSSFFSLLDPTPRFSPVSCSGWTPGDFLWRRPWPNIRKPLKSSVSGFAARWPASSACRCRFPLPWPRKKPAFYCQRHCRRHYRFAPQYAGRCLGQRLRYAHRAHPRGSGLRHSRCARILSDCVQRTDHPLFHRFRARPCRYLCTASHRCRSGALFFNHHHPRDGQN